jgi:hypothetical protein
MLWTVARWNKLTKCSFPLIFSYTWLVTCLKYYQSTKKFVGRNWFSVLRTLLDLFWDPLFLLFIGYEDSFPGVKLPARGFGHPPYQAHGVMPLLPSAPSVACNVWPLPIIQQKCVDKTFVRNVAWKSYVLEKHRYKYNSYMYCEQWTWFCDSVIRTWMLSHLKLRDM